MAIIESVYRVRERHDEVVASTSVTATSGEDSELEVVASTPYCSYIGT